MHSLPSAVAINAPLAPTSTQLESRRPDMLDRKQAAAYLGMSEPWLAHAGEDGPPFVRIGGRRVYYLLSDLDT